MTNLMPRLSDITVKENRELTDGDRIIQRFIEELNSKNTQKAYAKSIYSFFIWLYGDRPLTLEMMVINPDIANRYSKIFKKRLENEEIKTSTYNSAFKGIKSFYDWLMNYTVDNTKGFKLIAKNPFDVVKQKSESRDVKGSDALTPEEIMLMINNPYGHNEHIKERNILMLILAITTGIRSTALLTIKEADIKLVDNNYVISTIDKEDKQVLRPINNYHQRLMKWYNDDKKFRIDGDTIFNIHPSYANTIISKWVREVGINKFITFHGLRATCAVLIYEQTDKNLFRVQAMLNHSHVETSKIYVDKGNKINHDGELLIENIVNANAFEDKIKDLSKDELLKILTSLDSSVKIKILKDLE